MVQVLLWLSVIVDTVSCSCLRSSTIDDLHFRQNRNSTVTWLAHRLCNHHITQHQCGKDRQSSLLFCLCEHEHPTHVFTSRTNNILLGAKFTRGHDRHSIASWCQQEGSYRQDLQRASHCWLDRGTAVSRREFSKVEQRSASLSSWVLTLSVIRIRKVFQLALRLPSPTGHSVSDLSQCLALKLSIDSNC